MNGRTRWTIIAGLAALLALLAVPIIASTGDVGIEELEEQYARDLAAAPLDIPADHPVDPPELGEGPMETLAPTPTVPIDVLSRWVTGAVKNPTLDVVVVHGEGLDLIGGSLQEPTLTKIEAPGITGSSLSTVVAVERTEMAATVEYQSADGQQVAVTVGADKSVEITSRALTAAEAAGDTHVNPIGGATLRSVNEGASATNWYLDTPDGKTVTFDTSYLWFLAADPDGGFLVEWMADGPQIITPDGKVEDTGMLKLGIQGAGTAEYRDDGLLALGMIGNRMLLVTPDDQIVDISGLLPRSDNWSVLDVHRDGQLLYMNLVAATVNDAGVYVYNTADNTVTRVLDYRIDARLAK